MPFSISLFLVTLFYTISIFIIFSIGFILLERHLFVIPKTPLIPLENTNYIQYFQKNSFQPMFTATSDTVNILINLKINILILGFRMILPFI